ESLLTLASAGWVSRALGLLVIAPPLLVVLTPLLVERDWVSLEAPLAVSAVPPTSDWTWGERIETAGLRLGLAIVMLALGVIRVAGGLMNWRFWTLSWLIVAWTA